jgi:hypothetical protein
MSFSNPSNVRVVADAPYPTAEIYLFDQSLAQVASSVGPLDAQLRPGLYKIKYVAAEATAEKIFEVPPDSESVHVTTPKLEINTPIFLTPTEPDLPDPGAALAEGVSGNIEPSNKIGDGGELLIVVRSPEGENAPVTPAEKIARGLKLCNRHGDELRNVGQAAISSPDSATAACSFALDPGYYLLRVDGKEHQTVEQTLVVSHSWQTQIFLAAQVTGGCAAPDFSDAGVLMARHGEGFRSKRPEPGWAELSRRALAARRPSAPINTLKAALTAARGVVGLESRVPPEMFPYQFTDPMFAIFAAHLLILSPRPDTHLLREVADHLKQLVGDHPDVMSLYLWLDPKADVPPFSSPPMLRSSWNIVVNRSAEREDIVPPGSYASRIPTRLWGSGAWLSWRVPERLSWSATPASQIELKSCFEPFLKNAEAAGEFEQAAEALRKERPLQEPERRLLAYVEGIAKSSSAVGQFAREGVGGGFWGVARFAVLTVTLPWIRRQAHKAAEKSLQPESIIGTLGMPESTLAQAAGDLLAKFKDLRLLQIERRGARTAADVLAEEFAALHPDAHLEDQTLEGIYQSIHNLSSDRTGLCLAGGGLRGAFFNLGLMEGLAKRGLLDKFHYLSTVSGGSYIGAWFSAWRYHTGDDHEVLRVMAGRFPTFRESPFRRPVFQLGEENDDVAARRGLLSAGLWTRYGAYARNLLLTWLIYGPLLLTFLMMPKLYLAFIISSWSAPTAVSVAALLVAAIFLFFTLTVRELRKTQGIGRRKIGLLDHTKEGLVPLSAAGALVCAAAPLWLHSGWTTLLIAAGVGGAALFGASWIISHAVTTYRGSAPALLRWCAWTLAGAIGSLLFAAALADLNSLFTSSSDPSNAPALAIGAVAVMLLAIVVADMVYLGLMSRFKGSGRDRAWQAASAGRLSVAAIMWVIFASVDLFGPVMLSDPTSLVVTAGGISGAVGGVTGALAIAMGFQSLEVSRWRKVVSTASVYLAEAVAIFLLGILAVVLSANADALIEGLHTAIKFDGASKLVATAGAAILCFVVTVIMASAIDLGVFAQHAAERSHLARRFLGAAASNAGHSTGESDASDDLPMSVLGGARQHKRDRYLFPVINMALDHLGDRRRERGDSFTVTPLSAGSGTFGYRSSTDYCASDGGISLGTAMIISGVGAEGDPGRNTTPLIALVLSLLAARPGLWLGNPRSDAASRRAYPRFSFMPTLEEIFGWGPGDYIHVSTAARFEALGLYEMIRRRCKFIVISDAGYDPNCTLADLGNAVRRIWVDYGVAIRLQDTDLTGRRTPGASSYCALGSIRYPEAPNHPGTLIYLKPALDGTEPPDVRGYAATHPLFPHERLASWRFGEAASESYRALGNHIVGRLCGREHFGAVAPDVEQLSPAQFARCVQEYLTALL